MKNTRVYLLDKKDSREGLGFYVVTRAPFKLSPDDAAKYPGNKKIGIFKVIEAEILPVSEYNPVQGHFLIGAFNEFNKAPGWECRHPTSIIGIAEDEKELEDKLYECALKYAKRIAESRKCEFMNTTCRGRKKQLEEKAASASRQ